MKLGLNIGSSAVMVLVTGLLGGCATNDPVAMIPDGARAVLEHEAPPGSDHQPISVETLLGAARGEPSPEPQPSAARDGPSGSHQASPSAVGAPSQTPISMDQLLTAARGGATASDQDGATVMLDLASSTTEPFVVDADARARLQAAVRNLQPGNPVRARITIGPMPDQDQVTGLARAERYAEAVSDVLPDRVRPALVEYRPAMPPNRIWVRFQPAEGAANG